MTRIETGRKLCFWVIASLIAGALLYFSLHGVDWRQVTRDIGRAEWRFLAAAAAISTVSYLVRAARWRILLNAEARLGLGAVFWANMAGYLGNNFLPARAGELLRSVLVSNRSRLSKTYVLTTALSERLVDAITLVLVSSLVLLGIEPKPAWVAAISRTMAVLAGGGALAVMVLPHTGTLPSTIFQRVPLPQRVQDQVARLGEQVLLALRSFHEVRRLAGFAILTAAIWLCDAGGVIVGARALGIRLSFSAALLLLAGLGLGSALPSTPGYVGVYQFVAVTTLAPFGIGRDSALAYILLAQATGYLVVVAFGLPGLFLSRAISGKELSASASDPARRFFRSSQALKI